jgi:transcriptional regulator with XRE-family HTH domain
MQRGQGATPGAGIDGARLRERRAQLGLTQAELAQRSGLSQEAISRIENGRIRGLMQPTQDALAAALEASVSWLRGGDGAEAPRAPEPSRELVVVPDDDDPLVAAIGHAFDWRRHTVVDSYAVLRTLRETDRRLVEGGDLADAARRWLDAAAALRREGIAVTTENLLMRLTVGRSGREREGVRARAGHWEAEAEAASRRHEVDETPARPTSKKKR